MGIRKPINAAMFSLKLNGRKTFNPIITNIKNARYEMFNKALIPAKTDAKNIALVGRSERYKFKIASIDRMMKRFTNTVGPA